MADFPDFSQNSLHWAYNQPGWKPRCVRCNQRRKDCHKYNSTDLGMFAGEWICDSCVKTEDTFTPAESVLYRVRQS